MPYQNNILKISLRDTGICSLETLRATSLPAPLQKSCGVYTAMKWIQIQKLRLADPRLRE